MQHNQKIVRTAFSSISELKMMKPRIGFVSRAFGPLLNHFDAVQGANMARTNLDGLFFMDKRFDHLGELTGRGKHDDRSRMLNIWQFCMDRMEDVMSAKAIGIQSELGAAKGPEFAGYLVEADLAEKIGEGMYRIRGVRARWEWILKKKEAGKKGGRPKKVASKSGDDENETFGKAPDENQNLDESTGKAPDEIENHRFSGETNGFEDESTGNPIVMDIDRDMDIDTDTDIFYSEKQKQFIKVVISDAINCVHDRCLEDDAEKRIHPLGWALLMKEFSTWRRFYERFAQSYQNGYEPKFRADTLNNILARIEQKPRGAKPKPARDDLRLVAGGAG